MNRINLIEMQKQKDFFTKAIDDGQRLMSFCVANNQAFKELDNKQRDLFDNKNTLIFYNHTFEFAFYIRDDESNKYLFRIKSDGSLELMTSDDKVVEFAKEAHSIINKEFY